METIVAAVTLDVGTTLPMLGALGSRAEPGTVPVRARPSARASGGSSSLRSSASRSHATPSQAPFPTQPCVRPALAGPRPAS